MRLLLVTNDFPPKPGGIQQYLAGLVEAAPGPVRILAPRDRDAVGDVVRDRRRFMWPTRRIRKWVEQHVADFEPDLVLFGAPHPLAHLGPKVRRRTGIPYAVLTHGAEITVPAAFPGLRQLVRYPLRRADGLLAVSDFTARRVERLAKSPVRVIGAGVAAEFSPRPPPEEPPVVIGCVSRFVPRKGQARLLEAAAALRAEGRDVAVFLAGTGRDEKRLRRLADRLHVPTRFRVGASFAELPSLYRQMHVFAMPCRSRWMGLEVEGFGVVFLEAAASGLPVVAGDSGGSPETVRQGSTGFVVDGVTPLIDALRVLVDDQQLRATFGAAGAKWAAASFSWEAVGRRFESACAEITGNA